MNNCWWASGEFNCLYTEEKFNKIAVPEGCFEMFYINRKGKTIGRQFNVPVNENRSFKKLLKELNILEKSKVKS